MQDKIAGDEDVIKRICEKTGQSREVVKENLKYLSMRTKQFMEEENTHQIRLSGLFNLIETYGMLRSKAFIQKNKKYQALLLRKGVNLSVFLKTLNYKESIPFMRKPSFLYRKRYKMTDEELENHLNNE